MGKKKFQPAIDLSCVPLPYTFRHVGEIDP